MVPETDFFINHIRKLIGRLCGYAVAFSSSFTNDLKLKHADLSAIESGVFDAGLASSTN